MLYCVIWYNIILWRIVLYYIVLFSAGLSRQSLRDRICQQLNWQSSRSAGSPSSNPRSSRWLCCSAGSASDATKTRSSCRSRCAQRAEKCKTVSSKSSWKPGGRRQRGRLRRPIWSGQYRLSLMAWAVGAAPTRRATTIGYHGPERSKPAGPHGWHQDGWRNTKGCVDGWHCSVYLPGFAARTTEAAWSACGGHEARTWHACMRTVDAYLRTYCKLYELSQ